MKDTHDSRSALEANRLTLQSKQYYFALGSDDLAALAPHAHGNGFFNLFEQFGCAFRD